MKFIWRSQTKKVETYKSKYNKQYYEMKYNQEGIDCDDAYDVKKVAEDMFDGFEIKSSEYLYNLDESEDYIYVEFDGGGYAIFYKTTMELMEYSPQGDLEYSAEDNLKKYYGGPNTYLKKTEDGFVDIKTMERIQMADTTKRNYSKSIREILTNTYNQRKSKKEVEFNFDSIESCTDLYDLDIVKGNDEYIGTVPKIDTDKLITGLDISNGVYIPNFWYFLSDPTHGNNTSGTCGAVSAQLLLSYHNYYSDRRIIPNQFLNGGDTTFGRSSNPNLCENPMSMTSNTLGSRGRAEDGSDDENSYFAMVVDEIPANATTGTVKKGLKSLLNNQNIDYTISSKEGGWFLGTLAVDTSGIIKEIDNGRPVIVLMQSSLGGEDHYVVAYGYQDYTYVDSSDTYSGFITHFGWGAGETSVWINSAWCYSYITLKINHSHEYSIVGTIESTGAVEYRCNECGHRTDEIVLIASNNRYTEMITDVNAGAYKEYRMTFKSAGNKVIQTFGTKDTILELYSSDGKLLVGKSSTDDDGYSLNALLSYEFSANTEYILRVRYYKITESGSLKVAIIPTYHHDYYEKAYGLYGITTTASLSIAKGNVAMYRYKFSSTGYVAFTTTSTKDTFLYIIDPTSTKLMTKYTGSNKSSSNLYDDDSGDGLLSKIEKKVTANKHYLVIVSFYNPSTTTGTISITTTQQ